LAKFLDDNVVPVESEIFSPFLSQEIAIEKVTSGVPDEFAIRVELHCKVLSAVGSDGDTET
jgi:hypothetical protein